MRERFGTAGGSNTGTSVGLWQAEVIASTVEGIITVRKDGTLLSINPAAAQLLGVEEADAVGRSMELFIPERFHRVHRAYVQGFFSSNIRAREMTARAPVPVRRGDGSEFLAELSLVRIDMEGGCAVACIMRDISERRRADQHLHLQARLLEQSRAAAVAFDAQGRVTYWNGAAERLYGCQRSEAMGQTVRELSVVAVDEQTSAQIRRAVLQGDDWEGDLRTVRGDGNSTVRVTMAPVRDNAGNFLGAVSHAFDVTEQRQAEALLHAQADLLQEIASNGGLEGGLDALCRLVEKHFPGVRCTIHLVDADGAGLRFAAGYRMRPLDVDVEYTPGAVSARLGEPVLVEDFRADENFLAIHPRVFESGVRSSASLPVFVHDHVRGAVTLTFERPGVPGIREQRLLETAALLVEVAIKQDLANAARMEAQKFEGVGSLAAGIAHDFNNILTSIIGNAAIARLTTPRGTPASEALRDIEIAGQRAGELAHQLLAYAGRDQQVTRPFDLNALVREMTQLLRVSLKPGLQLKYRLSTGLPLVCGDATQVRQVVMNLVLNASDAIEEASGQVRVSSGQMEADERYLSRCRLGEQCNPGTYAYLEVRDSGMGMDSTTLARLFEPYFSTKFTGRGLGLAAVFGIVRSHGGAIHVRSRPGQGTTFRVLFPLTRQELGSAVLEPASAPGRMAARCHGHARVGA